MRKDCFLHQLFPTIFTTELDECDRKKIKDLASLSFSGGGHYIAHTEATRIAGERKKFAAYLQEIRPTVCRDDKDRIDAFVSFAEGISGRIKQANWEFIQKETARYWSLFADIDGKALDVQQIQACITDEEATLVLAGAGAGKTTTLAGKVKYLTAKGVAPKDILVVAFTKKAAEEIAGRIRDKLGIDVSAVTFHKLGLDLIQSVSTKPFQVCEDTSKFIEEYFDQKIHEDRKFSELLLEFFAYYLNVPADVSAYNTIGEAFEHDRAADFTTFKGRMEEYAAIKAQEMAQNHVTIHGERVKSLQEVAIANFLFMHGIDYEYEKVYPYETGDQYHKIYQPDFYLPKYDIYLEHFGINREGRLPQYPRVEQLKYLQGMKWKRDLHAAKKTKLLETYSYQFTEGTILVDLEAMLKKEGVEFSERDAFDIFEALYGTAAHKYMTEFTKLCGSFLALFKSNGYKLENLDGLYYKNLKNKGSAFTIRRTWIFKEIMRDLISSYNAYLSKTGQIDFSDMIIKATDLVKTNAAKTSYKYILVDEYQDISVARFNLIKAMVQQSGAHLTAVGDDWQSIFRFAGSDISLFSGFAKAFPGAEICKIEQTYRNSQELIDVAAKFIMKNPNQMKKQLRSKKNIEKPITFIEYKSNCYEALRMALDDLIEENGKEKSILLLGRTRYDEENCVAESGLFRYNSDEKRRYYVGSPETPIEFLTVHKAKGLEADAVILLNFENKTLGFPNKISDDPLLQLVLSQGDSYEYAEERRLLYVALTRTRGQVYVLVNHDMPSEFYREFANNPNCSYLATESVKEGVTVHCPKCRTGVLLLRYKTGTSDSFIGCSNYPQCDYHFNDTSILYNGPKVCPDCGGFLVYRNGIYGPFWGCSNFPNCRYTLKDY